MSLNFVKWNNFHVPSNEFSLFGQHKSFLSMGHAEKCTLIFPIFSRFFLNQNMCEFELHVDHIRWIDEAFFMLPELQFTNNSHIYIG